MSDRGFVIEVLDYLCATGRSRRRLFRGIRLNLSKRGVSSLSVGRRGLWFNADRRGTRTTAGPPGMGLRWTSETRPHGARSRLIVCISLGWLAAAFVMALLLSLAPARASDATGGYTAMGYGSKSCGAYNDARTTKNDLGYQAWLAGYITATNVQLPDTYDISGSTDLEGLLGWLDNWCHANPTVYFTTAARSLVDFLYPSRRTKALSQ